MAETQILPGFSRGLFHYSRRRTRVVMVGKVGVGGDNPIRVQSMTTTDTLNVDATVAQSIKMIEAGCEIVRITAPTVNDARALGKIKEGLVKRGYGGTPLVADIHFSPAAAMEAADFVEKVRINPGNFVDTKKFAIKEYTDQQYDDELRRIEDRFSPLVIKLRSLKRALRIGTNHGSLSDRIMNRYGDSALGMVESALEFVRICEKNDYRDVILSMKSSNPKVMIEAYRLLAARMSELGMDYPFHLGVTEAGGGEDGRIKSAIGIGSLLADGIGDTIRVSLTEDPDLEVPVCYALAKPYQAKPDEAPRPGTEGLKPFEDAFSYKRRPTRAFRAGPFMVGGSQLVRTALRAPKDDLLAFLERQLKEGKGVDPELIEFSDLTALKKAREALAGETSRLAFVARTAKCAPCAVDLCDVYCGPVDDDVLARMKEKDVRWLIEEETAGAALRQDERAREFGVLSMLSLRGSDTAKLLQEYRLLAAQAGSSPIHIRVPRLEDSEQQLLQASVLMGSLLCDGVGDSVQLDAALPARQTLELTYNILQGAGVRVTKTEFVSCPSCGRTLFDLQSTTERIKSKTGHLKGVKIAIMGCIVNGPGEMADADFGYVGGAPDMINLYVGKECVKKGIPTAHADQALIDLIKAHGKWKDPA